MATERLRACPTCGTPRASARSLGLRDYSWANEYLPGAEGATDGDFILEKGGEILMLEIKPWRVGLGLGQRIALRAFVRKGIHIWLVHESEEEDAKGRPLRVRVGAMDRRGDVPFMAEMSLEALKDAILKWRLDAEKGLL